MIGLLQTIVDSIVCWIETAGVTVINFVISACGFLWATLVAALPSMPDLPGLPSLVQKAIGYAYYFVDVGWIMAYVASFFALMAAVFLLMIPLRWIKAVG